MFKFEDIYELENIQQWEEAKNILVTKWLENKSDLKILINLGTLCWYILVFWERIENKGLKKDTFQIILEDVTNYSMDNFYDNFEFLWVFGYMITLFPYYFGDYEEYEQKGKEMLSKAHRLNPTDSLITMLFLNDQNNDEYKTACIYVKTILDERFKENTPLNRYFKNVFNRI